MPHIKTQMRTVKELLADSGILEQEKDVFREDILSFLEECTGSIHKAFQLGAVDLQRYSARFVESDRGTFYFARRGSSNEWRHGRSREDVMRALPDLMHRYLKNKRDTLRKSDISWHSKQNPKSLSIKRDGKTTDSDSDDDYEDLPDIPFAPEADEISLPDIVEIFSPRKPPRQMPPPPKSPVQSTPNPEVQNCHDLDAYTSICTNLKPSALTNTPFEPTKMGLLSPPVTSPKRKHLKMARSDSEASRESSMSKRIRQYHGRPSPTPEPPIAFKPKVPLLDRHTAPAAEGRDETVSPTPTFEAPTRPRIQTIPCEPSVNAVAPLSIEQAPGIIMVPLSHTSALSQKVKFDQGGLQAIPSAILDYLRKCEKVSLMKANAGDVSADEKKQYRDRCKLFRDLHADLESRIMNLSTSQAKQELADPGGNSSQEHSTSEWEISSYALWD